MKREQQPYARMAFRPSEWLLPAFPLPTPQAPVLQRLLSAIPSAPTPDPNRPSRRSREMANPTIYLGMCDLGGRQRLFAHRSPWRRFGKRRFRSAAAATWATATTKRLRRIHFGRSIFLLSKGPAARAAIRF